MVWEVEDVLKHRFGSVSLKFSKTVFGLRRMAFSLLLMNWFDHFVFLVVDLI